MSHEGVWTFTYNAREPLKISGQMLQKDYFGAKGRCGWGG